MKENYSPWDFVNAINYTKVRLMDDNPDVEKEYKKYIVKRALSFSHDTVLYANEMNKYPHLDNKLEFDFLLNIIRSRKRFSKWLKPDKIKDLDAIQTYYGYSTTKAKEVLDLHSGKQLQYIKNRLEKGGLKRSKK
jgi:hypothetical protein|tara:strand:+ start:4709 stop:5113 length:405 start_codon:yes stop_codon:yes gene_type:complete